MSYCWVESGERLCPVPFRPPIDSEAFSKLLTPLLPEHTKCPDPLCDSLGNLPPDVTWSIKRSHRILRKIMKEENGIKKNSDLQ